MSRTFYAMNFISIFFTKMIFHSCFTTNLMSTIFTCFVCVLFIRKGISSHYRIFSTTVTMYMYIRFVEFFLFIVLCICKSCTYKYSVFHSYPIFFWLFLHNAWLLIVFFKSFQKLNGFLIIYFYIMLL